MSYIPENEPVTAITELNDLDLEVITGGKDLLKKLFGDDDDNDPGAPGGYSALNKKRREFNAPTNPRPTPPPPIQLRSFSSIMSSVGS